MNKSMKHSRKRKLQRRQAAGPGRRGNPHRRCMHDDGRVYGKYIVKPDRQISDQDLARALRGEPLSTGHRPRWGIHPTRNKSYVAIVYHTGARKLEPAHVKKADMTIDETHVYVSMPAFKHGERAGVLKIRRDLVGMEWVVQQYSRVKQKNRLLWPLSPSTAWRTVKDALGIPPHWLRHNWITTAQRRLPGQPSEVDQKIQSWTGIKHRETLDNYRLKQEKDIADVSEIGV